MSNPNPSTVAAIEIGTATIKVVIARVEDGRLIPMSRGTCFSQGISAGVVNMRFAKPLDRELLLQQAAQYKNLATLEEGILTGGVGSGVLELLNSGGLLPQTRVFRFGLPDEFVSQGDKKLLFHDLGLAPEQIAETLAQALTKGSPS